MQITQTTNEQIAHYINFHSHPHASSYNTIDGIIAGQDLKESIQTIMELLQRKYVFLDYATDTDVEEFLRSFSQALTENQVLFICTDTLQFDARIYDQLMQLRTHNALTLDTENTDGTEQLIHPEAKLFLVLQDKGSALNDLYTLTDHVLDLKGVVR